VSTDRQRLCITITRGQARTLEALLNTQLLVSEDHRDLQRYQAIREAVSRALCGGKEGKGKR
jgi:hypothetical protein